MRAGNSYRELIRRIAKGARFGLAAGAFFSVTALLAFAIGGARTAARAGTDAIHVVVVYLIGFAACGSIAGALYPLTRRRIGAWVVGVMSSPPLALGITLNIVHGQAPPMEFAIVSTAGTLIVGSIIGYNLYRLRQEEDGDAVEDEQKEP